MSEKTREWIYCACLAAAPAVAFTTVIASSRWTIKEILTGMGLALILAILTVATRK